MGNGGHGVSMGLSLELAGSARFRDAFGNLTGDNLVRNLRFESCLIFHLKNDDFFFCFLPAQPQVLVMLWTVWYICVQM